MVFHVICKQALYHKHDKLSELAALRPYAGLKAFSGARTLGA